MHDVASYLFTVAFDLNFDDMCISVELRHNYYFELHLAQKYLLKYLNKIRDNKNKYDLINILNVL